MRPEKTEFTLASIHGGRALQLVDEAMQDVWQNVLDDETEAEKKRSVTLTLTISPTEGRNMADVTVDVRTKLAPRLGVTSLVAIDDDGKASEFRKQETFAVADVLAPGHGFNSERKTGRG